MDPNTRKEHESKAQAMLVDGTQLQQPRKGRSKPQHRRPAQEQALAVPASNFVASGQPAASRPQPQGRGKHQQRKDEVGSASRLEQEVVSSRLWVEDCQQLQPPLADAVPTTFNSLQQYIDTFEPLLFEEAAESIRSGYEESERAGKAVQVVVQLCAKLDNGWFNLRLAAANQDAVTALRQLQGDRDASVVVLQLSAAPPAAAAAGGGRGTPPLQQQQVVARVTGLVRWWEGDQAVVYVHIRPCCGRHPPTPISPCCKVLEYLQQQPSANWQLIPAGSIVTSIRECGTLARLQQIPILDYILHPSKPGSRRSSLTDSAAAAAAADLPPEVSSPGFWAYLHNSFDQPQIQAIKCSAAHLVKADAAAAEADQQQQQQEPKDDAMQIDLVSDSDSEIDLTTPQKPAGGVERLPFTLIQGPPGTGKTHTVLGVLNTWHLVQFQRFFMSLDSAVRGLVVSGVQIERELISDDFAAGLAQRPRILVCAPSNAAIDELLERILRGTFRDVNGNIYRPDVVRLGSEEALSSEARQVWVEQLCGRLLSHNPASFAAEHNEQQQNMRMILTRIRNISESLYAAQQNLRDARAQAADAAAAVDAAVTSGGSTLPAASAAADADKEVKKLEQQTLSMVGQMVNEFEQLRKTQANLSRLAMVNFLVAGPGSIEWGRKLAGIQAAKSAHHHHHHQQQQQQPRPPVINQPELWRAAFRAAPREVQQDLEISFVDQAEMVFTTLSSSAREVFNRLQRPFELVLIDEAAQAAEIAALQPLVHGARAVVMVGDPQQLPATIFSQAAKQLALERSLFERLAAAGCPVNVLKVQYRMHPAIRTFPSGYFYGNALIDAPSVLARPRPWFYPALGSSAGGADGVLIPYVVYDVSRGRERFIRGRSAENELEARMAVALYGELRRVAAAQAQRPPARLEVGVITPYRSQRMLLRKLFEQAFGKEVLREVKIETVDSFQGKQLDIVILSCVRASSSSSSDDGSNMRPAKFAVQKQQQQQKAASLAGSEGNNAAAAAAAAVSAGQQQLALNPKKGVGFLSDTRRMNVAITRARQALYILGHCDTLVSHPAWESLIADAGIRECVIWDASPDHITDQSNRVRLAGRLLKGRQLQEAMAPQQQQQPLPPAADQQQQPADMAVDRRDDQQQQRRSATPPAAAATAEEGATAAAAVGGSSGNAWLQMLAEQQDAERKRKAEQQQAKQLGKLKRQKVVAPDASPAAAAGTASDGGEGSLPETPTHAAAAAAAAAGREQQQQKEPSRLQHQTGPEQQQQQQQEPGPQQQQQQQTIEPKSPQQQQQQQGVDEIWQGTPGDGFEPYHGLTAQQGAVLWLLSPLIQQCLLKLLLALPQQERDAALRSMNAKDLAWLLPLLQQRGAVGAAAAAAQPQQQQQQGPPSDGLANPNLAHKVMQPPGNMFSNDGGQMLLPGGILPPAAAAGPQQQQQLLMHPVMQQQGGLQLQTVMHSGPSSTGGSAAAAGAGGQIMLLPVHSPALGPQAAAAAAQPPLPVLGPGGFTNAAPAAAARGDPANALNPHAAGLPPPLQQQQLGFSGPPGFSPAAAAALNPNAAPPGPRPPPGPPPTQQQQQHPTQFVVGPEGALVPAPRPPPAPPGAAAAGPAAAAAAGGGSSDTKSFDGPPTAKQLKRIARNERRRREREVREIQEGLELAQLRERERVQQLQLQQQQQQEGPGGTLQQQQQQQGLVLAPPPWRQQQPAPVGAVLVDTAAAPWHHQQQQEVPPPWQQQQQHGSRDDRGQQHGSGDNGNHKGRDRGQQQPGRMEGKGGKGGQHHHQQQQQQQRGKDGNRSGKVMRAR